MLPTKALSVHAPWAWAIMRGGKDVENRGSRFSRKTVGEIWVHTTLWPRGDRKPVKQGSKAHGRLCELAGVAIGTALDTGALASAIDAPSWEELDAMRGHIVGRVTVAGYRTPDDPPDSRWHIDDHIGVILSDPRPLETPVPAIGALGYWTVPDAVLCELEKNVR